MPDTPPAHFAGIRHRHIEVFRAVMLTGSATAAAQMLHTSQPTISRELARLEQLLSFALFERQGGRLQPNARALRLWDAVQRSWSGLEQVVEAAQHIAQPQHTCLEVVSLPALSHALLPAAIARLHARHGPVGIHMTPQEEPLLQEWMSAQRFDLGLTELAATPPGTRSVALPPLHEVAVLPPNHPLAAKAVLTATDFAHQPFISLAAHDPYRQHIDRIFAQAGVQRHLHLHTHSAVAVCALVAQGLGVAIVNPLTAHACAGVVVRPLAFAIAFQVQLLLPLHRPAVAEVDALVAAIAEVVAQVNGA